MVGGDYLDCLTLTIMNSIPIQVTELLNYSYSLAKTLLETQQEFFPFGVFMDYRGNVSQRLVQDGDEYPISEVLIEHIQKDFDEQLASRNITAYSIIYNARARNEQYPEGIDVVVAKVKGIYDDSLEVYYLPYQNIEGQFEYLEPWGEKA
jgi:hypothetical protein